MRDGPKEPKEKVFVIFRLDENHDIKIPWVEFRAKELFQSARMFCSSEPSVRDYGKGQLQAFVQEIYDLTMEVYLERLKHEETRQLLSPAGKKGADKRWKKDGSRWGENDEVRKILAKLAAITDRWGGVLSAKELWPLLYSELELAQLSGVADVTLPSPER